MDSEEDINSDDDYIVNENNESIDEPINETNNESINKSNNNSLVDIFNIDNIMDKKPFEDPNEDDIKQEQKNKEEQINKIEKILNKQQNDARRDHLAQKKEELLTVQTLEKIKNMQEKTKPKMNNRRADLIKEITFIIEQGKINLDLKEIETLSETELLALLQKLQHDYEKKVDLIGKLKNYVYNASTDLIKGVETIVPMTEGLSSDINEHKDEFEELIGMMLEAERLKKINRFVTPGSIISFRILELLGKRILINRDKKKRLNLNTPQSLESSTIQSRPHLEEKINPSSNQLNQQYQPSNYASTSSQPQLQQSPYQSQFIL
jgi:hypothetical protein